jgi:hypothetical protein
VTKGMTRFWKDHASAILVTLAILIVAIGSAVALNAGYDARDRANQEKIARQHAVAKATCEQTNDYNRRFLTYLEGLASGANTAAVPIPDDLPSSVKVFLENARAANRAYAANALADARSQFTIVRCK